jgi:hypothetical protein
MSTEVIDAICDKIMAGDLQETHTSNCAFHGYDLALQRSSSAFGTSEA